MPLEIDLEDGSARIDLEDGTSLDLEGAMSTITGRLSVAFSVLSPGVGFTMIQPGVGFSTKQPGVTFTMG